MADKLEWMNKHFVLLRRRTVQETIELEKYKLRADLKDLVTDSMSSEDFIYKLESLGKYKEACDYLAYAMHRRAAVWWGYRCLLSLFEELKENPAVERDIADIGAPKDIPPPEWAQMPDEKLMEEQAEKEKNETIEELNKVKSQLDDAIAQAKSIIPPEVQAVWDKIYGDINEQFKATHGMTLDELVAKAAEHKDKLFEIDENSPLFAAADKVRADIEASRKETIDLLKSVIPPKVPEHEKQKSDDAMKAVYRWIVAPDEVNSSAALEIGNECPDQVAGLLAMTAFWSFGNMTPDGNQVIMTPAGLAANGLSSTLLNAALSKGGNLKYLERCKLYLDLGLKVVWGEDNWGETLENKEMPHQEIFNKTPEIKTEETEEIPVYKKWNINSVE